MPGYLDWIRPWRSQLIAPSSRSSPQKTSPKACGVESQVIDELNDIDYGAWQLRSYEQIEETNPELFAAWFATPHLGRFPDGESLQDMVARTAMRFGSFSIDTLRTRSCWLGIPV